MWSVWRAGAPRQGVVQMPLSLILMAVARPPVKQRCWLVIAISWPLGSR